MFKFLFIYLKTFSDVLTTTFAEYGLVARMGGDEFIAVLTNIDNVNISELTEIFSHNMNAVNEVHQNWNMSAAFGVYYSHEEYATSSRDGLRIADTRMYDNKTAMKSKKE